MESYIFLLFSFYYFLSLFNLIFLRFLQFDYLYRYLNKPMATRAKYTRLRQEDKKEEKPDTDILMRFSPSYGRYISRALTLFFGQGKSFVTVKAADRLMDRALWVAQVLKRRVQGLHQITQVKEREIVDVYEPREEGLLRVEQKRFLTIIEIVLTKEPTAQQKKAPGYQAPFEGKNQEFLTKQKWEKQQAERKQKIGTRGERGERRQTQGRRYNRDNRDNRDNRENRETKPYRENRDNRDNRDTRGGERRRGRN